LQRTELILIHQNHCLAYRYCTFWGKFPSDQSFAIALYFWR
jgi:hypothetical protein